MHVVSSYSMKDQRGGDAQEETPNIPSFTKFLRLRVPPLQCFFLDQQGEGKLLLIIELLLMSRCSTSIFSGLRVHAQYCYIFEKLRLL